MTLRNIGKNIRIAGESTYPKVEKSSKICSSLIDFLRFEWFKIGKLFKNVQLAVKQG